MREHNLTRGQVSQLVHRTPNYITMWRTGKSSISEATMRLLELELQHGRGKELIEARAG